MIKKFIIILSSVMILSGQSPPEIFVDGEERDIKIRPNIAGTEVVLLGATPAGQRESAPHDVIQVKSNDFNH